MSILENLFTGSSHQAYQQIRSLVDAGRGSVISFLYFANLMKGRLLEGTPQDWQKKYLRALDSADLLLADGIALQLFYRLGNTSRSRPANLNGTDFIPYVIDQLVEEGVSTHISLFTLYDPKIGKEKDHIHNICEKFKDRFGVSIDRYDQIDYLERKQKEFDISGFETAQESTNADVRIVLVCTGTPTQEIRTNNYSHIRQKHNCLVFNAGGMIDYVSGHEKRAPQRVVNIRVGEALRRLVTQPKKNRGKISAMFGIFRRGWYRLRQFFGHL